MESKVIYNMFNTLFPILYVWCTPLLANIGFCNKNKSLLGNTLSNYIATPQATGMMAVSYYSVSNIMMSKRFYRAFAVPSGAEKGFYISGIFYEIFFGMFLCSPVTYYPTIHYVSVGGFVCCAYIHLIYLEYSPFFKNTWPLSLATLKSIGTLSLIGISVTSMIVRVVPIPNYLFFVFECIGLSSFILFMHIANQCIDRAAANPINTVLGTLV